MAAPARTPAQRRRDVERRLRDDVDLWVATASPDGAPYLVPLSFHWDGATVLLGTASSSPTGRNLETGRVRLALGDVRDVCLVDGTAEGVPLAELDPARADAFAARTGFDPRTLATPYRWFRVTPVRVQVWREENELSGRTVMRDGVWLVSDGSERQG